MFPRKSVASIVEFKSLGCRGRYVVNDNIPANGMREWWHKLEKAWHLTLPDIIFDVLGESLIDIEQLYKVASKAPVLNICYDMVYCYDTFL